MQEFSHQLYQTLDGELHYKGNSPGFLPASEMGVSKNRGTTKWMVYNGKPY